MQNWSRRLFEDGAGKARRRSARGATSRLRVTIIFPSDALSSPHLGFVVFFLYSMRRVHCRRCSGVLVEEVPWGDGNHQLTRAYMLLLARWARKLSWKETA